MFSVLFWRLALGMWAVIVKLLHLGLHTNIVAFFCNDFQNFFPSQKSVQETYSFVAIFVFRC
jgi:hypothetical protein